MDNPEKPTSWWQTTAGIMTGVAALLAAMTGLIHESCARGPIPPEVKSQMEVLMTGHNQRAAQLQQAIVAARQAVTNCEVHGLVCGENYNRQVNQLEYDLQKENESYQDTLNTLRNVR